MRAIHPLSLSAHLALAILGTLTLTVSASAQSTSSRPEQIPDKALLDLESDYEVARAEYLLTLGDHLRDAYREHFASLSKKDMETIASTRRLWQWYIDEGPFTMGDPRKQSTGIFRQEFLDPMDKVARILLIDPEKLKDPDVRKARARAFGLAEKLMRARKQAGIDIDPTRTKKAPTGLEYPRLDNPPTAVDNLELYERTMVLARTVGPRDAETALMKNAEACSEIDVQEADFAMYANQVRMLSGSIAWVVDPLMAACTRDFSNDRATGNGSGHQSTIPGKRFPRDRAQRFGCRSGPEGAGGAGPDGRSKIRGFAYNGTGHGGPLFARLRNVVAPGLRSGAFTAMYQTDDRFKHKCQATEGELVLPPGVSARDLGSGAVRTAFRALSSGAVAKAWSALENARKPDDPFDRALHHYMETRVEAEIDWTLDGIEHILDAGDVYEAEVRLQQAERTMKGVRRFDTRAAGLAARLSQRAVQEEIKVGKLYQKLISEKRRDPERLKQFIDQFPDSVYASAAKHLMEAGNDSFWPELFFFVMRDTHLNKWSYLTKERLERR